MLNTEEVYDIIKAMEKIPNSSSLSLFFTKKVWEYIEENLEPFFPGVKRIIVPDVFNNK